MTERTDVTQWALMLLVLTGIFLLFRLRVNIEAYTSMKLVAYQASSACLYIAMAVLILWTDIRVTIPEKETTATNELTEWDND